MLEKFVPVAFCLVLLGLMASSFSITESHPSRPGQQSCYRSLAGSGFLCAWEPRPGEKCWQTNSESSCTRSSSAAPVHRLSATRLEQAVGSN
jgi:hypothetical protein